MASPNLTVPENLLVQLQAAATAEGKTVNQLTTEALERDLAQRTLARWKREGDARRQGMTDEQVNEIVEQAIHESRAEARSR